MLNNFILVGKVFGEPTQNQITIAVTRPYKDLNNEYGTDFIDIDLWKPVEGLKQGDTIGIRGRIETRYPTDSKGNRTKETHLIADRVTFLSQTQPTTEQNIMNKGEI